MASDEKIFYLEKKIKDLERYLDTDKDYAQKALNFTKTTIYICSIIVTLFGLALYFLWGKTMSEVKSEATNRLNSIQINIEKDVKAKLGEIQSEEIFTQYKNEADKIIDGLQEDIERERRRDYLNNQRGFYSSFGEKDKALEIGETIIKEFPDDPFSYYEQAQQYAIYYGQEKEQEIKSLLNKAFELDPQEVNLYFKYDQFFIKYKDTSWYKRLLENE